VSLLQRFHLSALVHYQVYNLQINHQVGPVKCRLVNPRMSRPLFRQISLALSRL
jgi:hypothetical protein